MKRTMTALAATLGALLTPSLASAQAGPQLGDKGEFIFSADRLFPLLAYTRVSQAQLTGLPPNTTVNQVTTQTSLGFFHGTTPPLDTPYTTPRLGFDYMVTRRLTLGGDVLLYFTVGGSTTTETTVNNGATANTSTSSPSTTIFGIAPRVGYIWPINDLFSFWLRGGPSFYTQSVKSNSFDNNGVKTVETDNTNQFSLTVDPQFLITPVRHVAFTLGLTTDIPVAGGHSVNTETNGTSVSVSGNSNVFFFGVTAGLLAWF